jgi:hypothetical protein
MASTVQAMAQVFATTTGIVPAKASRLDTAAWGV